MPLPNRKIFLTAGRLSFRLSICHKLNLQTSHHPVIQNYLSYDPHYEGNSCGGRVFYKHVLLN